MSPETQNPSYEYNVVEVTGCYCEETAHLAAVRHCDYFDVLHFSNHSSSEDELLEWLLVSNKCPLDNMPLDPAQITKPRCVSQECLTVTGVL